MHDVESDLTFWVRSPSPGRPSSRALLFLPGLGLGGVPYLPFVLRLLCSRLGSSYDTLVVVEVPGISGQQELGRRQA